MGVIGILLFVIALVMTAFGIYFSIPQTTVIGNMEMIWTTSGLGAIGLFGGLSLFISSILIFALSGLCAAVVSCEFKYTSTQA